MIELLHIDCMEYMATCKDKAFDLVITDPPYPDYMTDKYGYYNGIIDFLSDLKCRQLIFWSAKVKFPLNYTAVHIWDKKCGVGSMYERIYERNGGANYRVYNYYLINSTVAASYTGDTFIGHPSQKPIKLINRLVNEYSEVGNTIFDPFMGSGTTAIACNNLNRCFVGCEIDKDYYDSALKRFNTHKMQQKLF